MSQQPLPVEPLSYRNSSEEKVRPLTRIAAWAAIFYGGGNVLKILLLLPTSLSRRGRIFTEPSARGMIPFLIAEVVFKAGVLTGGVQCLRRTPWGRRLLAGACIADAASLALYAIVHLSQLWRFLSRDRSLYFLIPSQIVELGLSVIVPTLIFILITRPDARNAFNDR